MRDTELYQQILGLSGCWHVKDVALSVETLKVLVHVEHAAGARFACSECGVEQAVYDHTQERMWRHLDSCQFQTLLVARIPRVKCAQHGVLHATVPWGEARSRFTLLMERLCLDVLRCTDVENGARLLGMSWKEAMRFLRRAVDRGLSRRKLELPKRLGVDDKHVGKTQPYVTVLSALDGGRVIDVLFSRKAEPLRTYLQQFPVEEASRVEAVAVDMWEPYTQAVYATIPDGHHKIVYDRFHIMQHAHRALDKVRQAEHRELVSVGDDRLTGAQQVFRFAEQNLPVRYRAKFEALRRADLKTSRAWALVENLRSLWSCPDTQTGQQHLLHWLSWAKQSALAPIKTLARTALAHTQGILNYFRHRTTSAVCEGLNNAIATLCKRAFGYRNLDNLRTVVLFHLGKLDLYPEGV